MNENFAPDMRLESSVADLPRAWQDRLGLSESKIFGLICAFLEKDGALRCS
jgi:hypothetical protein